uniref:Uncharacterized protein n=1 Tax=Anguilla anguilla TaxID=7936 RepID=A0A0E9W6X4_ANGAN
MRPADLRWVMQFGPVPIVCWPKAFWTAKASGFYGSVNLAAVQLRRSAQQRSPRQHSLKASAERVLVFAVYWKILSVLKSLKKQTKQKKKKNTIPSTHPVVQS